MCLVWSLWSFVLKVRIKEAFHDRSRTTDTRTLAHTQTFHNIHTHTSNAKSSRKPTHQTQISTHTLTHQRPRSTHKPKQNPQIRTQAQTKQRRVHVKKKTQTAFPEKLLCVARSLHPYILDHSSGQRKNITSFEGVFTEIGVCLTTGVLASFSMNCSCGGSTIVSLGTCRCTTTGMFATTSASKWRTAKPRRTPGSIYLGAATVFATSPSTRCNRITLTSVHRGPAEALTAQPTTTLPPPQTSVRRESNAVGSKDSSLSTDKTPPNKCNLFYLFRSISSFILILLSSFFLVFVLSSFFSSFFFLVLLLLAMATLSLSVWRICTLLFRTRTMRQEVSRAGRRPSKHSKI